MFVVFSEGRSESLVFLSHHYSHPFLYYSYGQFDALFQLVARMKSQLIDSRLDVASPVALFQNVVFVVVKSRHLASHPSYVFAKEGYQAEHPYRRFDAQEPCVAQLVVKQVAEPFRLDILLRR